MAVISAWISLFFIILSMRARSTLRILPRIGRIAWVRGSRASSAVPPAESPSTMNSSDSSALRGEQSFNLSGMPAPDSAVLRRVGVAGLLWGAGVAGFLGGDAGRGCPERFVDDLVGLGRVLLEPLGQPFVGGLLDEGPH